MERQDKNTSLAKTVVQRFFSSPPRLVISSFLIAVFVGWMLMLLPFSTRSGRPLNAVDALFTVTSGICVTGLTVIDIEKELSFFGQLILLIWIQLGGLGIMTFSTFFLLILRRAKLTFTGRSALHLTFTAAGSLNIYQLLFAIFKLTFVIEALGALLLFLSWHTFGGPTGGRLIWDAIFHSVSAFCNAGYSTFGDNLARYHGKILPLVIVALLIVLGGLGFIVLEEILIGKRFRVLKKGFMFYTLQTRLVLIVSGILLLSGALIFLLFDYNNSLLRDYFPGKLFHSFFQSVSARTCGFNSVDLSKASNMGLLTLIFLMFIGGSPGSCAGGIKTTTAAIIWATIISHIRTRDDVELFHRRLPAGTVSRAFIILVLSLLVVMLFFCLLAVVDRNILKLETEQDPALRLLFEVVSAFGTVGLSTGITPFFNDVGKLLLCLVMLTGRLGPLTIAVALLERPERLRYRYPEEDVMVG